MITAMAPAKSAIPAFLRAQTHNPYVPTHPAHHEAGGVYRCAVERLPARPLAAVTQLIDGLTRPAEPAHIYALGGAAVALALIQADCVIGASHVCMFSIGVGTGVLMVGLYGDDLGLMVVGNALLGAGLAGYTVVATAQRAVRPIAI